MIISYEKVTDESTTYTLYTPDDSQCTELATIGSTTYVHIPEGVVLSTQPEQIAGSIQEVTLTDTLRNKIKASSRHVRRINDIVREKIAEKYDQCAENKCLRLCCTNPERIEATAYTTYVEECVTWGKAQKSAIGLGDE